MNVRDILAILEHLDPDLPARAVILDQQGVMHDPIASDVDDITIVTNPNSQPTAVWLTGTAQDHNPPTVIGARCECGLIELMAPVSEICCNNRR